jgi:Uma2 family endonuclease
LISAALRGQLDRQLAEERWNLFGLGMRLRIRSKHGTFIYYPDITVEGRGPNEDFVDDPVVLMEIPSSASRRVDFGEKVLTYLKIPSLKTYVIVSDQPTLVVVYHRENGGAWKEVVWRKEEDIVDLPEIGCRLTLREIYQRVLSSGVA